ncbi:ABC transporter substrate-binding protein [Jiangella rhizosphaerae]|uniref:Extracellular solute-binding protein n=1 Tax=Jiangella rhizosphaerae TaxID=2293569 RepID=A0A418KWL4_9ACTN|nr:extracellular solute-binding protein [Jiangella rhizosphaerae]RIQ35873.1 extracellular solute-binding protein [Jiangella rhizosphaerae]
MLLQQLHRGPSPTRLLTISALAAGALVVTSCGSPAGGSDETAAGGDVCEGSRAVELIGETDGMDQQERQDQLVAEATETEGGEVDFYTEINDPQPVVDAFQEQYPDLTVNVYRAGSEQIRQRVLEESAANFPGADVVELDSLEMSIIDENGLLAPASSPYIDELTDAGKFENFTGDRLSYIVPVWNSGMMSADEAPTSLEDLADPRFTGRLALEGSDVFWFAGLVKYMESEEGKTRDEAVQVFRDIAANSAITSGHTTTTELVVAGQYAIAANNYIHRALELQAAGAPLEWAPVQIPVVAEITGIAVPCLSDNPAAALLLQDFVLSADGGQRLFVEEGRTPANASLAQETLGGETIEPIVVDVQEIADEYEEWATLWDEVIRGGGQG